MKLTYRRARHDDQPYFAEMLKALWEGHDYLPRQWDRWVEQPESIFLVGELAGRPVSCGRVIELVAGAWWLEGLRVDPAFKGQGLGRAIHEQLVARARVQPGVREIAYTTSSDNRIMQHLAEATGFGYVGSYRLLRTYDDPPAPDDAPELAIISGDARPWLDRLLAGAWLQATGGYIMEGWVARRMDEPFLAQRIEAGALSQLGDALALVGGGSHDDQSWLYALDGGDQTAQSALVRAAWRAGRGALRAFAPLDEALQAPLFSAGLRDAWEDEPFYCHHYVQRL